MLPRVKLDLMMRPKASAPVFVVSKRGTMGLQREVWSGNDISAAARRPPKPARLGNPGVFTRLHRRPGHKLLFGKRDAKAWFDQLRAPRELRAFFGRPQVRAGDLASRVGISLEELGLEQGLTHSATDLWDFRIH